MIAPSLVPAKAGDRVKTDRRDAEKLARCYRTGDLTAVWVPDAAHEALRDLVRAREDAKQDQQRARQRLGKFLLRHGANAPKPLRRSWTAKYLTWLNSHVHFEQPALEATLLDYVHEVHHAGERIVRWSKPSMRRSRQPPTNPFGDRRTASLARRGADDSRDRGGRSGLSEPLSESPAIDELQRSGVE